MGILTKILCSLMAILIYVGGVAGGMGTVAAATPGVGEKKEWVKVGFFAFDGYHNIDYNGAKSGYGYEFLQLVNRYNDWHYDYQGYDKSWSAMHDLLADGSIDVVTSAQKTPEREAKFLFSDKPIGYSSTVLTVRAGEKNIHAGDYSTYNGMRVGLLENNSRNQSFTAFAAAKGFTFRPVYYKSAPDLEKALQNNEAIDAAVSSDLRLTQNEWVLDKFDTTPFYAMVNRSRPDIMKGINYAIDQMDLYTPSWRTDLYVKYYTTLQTADIALSKAERAYLDKLKAEGVVLTVAMNPDRAPYSYFNNGKPGGINYQIFKLMADSLGLKYKIVQTKDRAEYRKALDKGDIDIHLGAIFDYYEAEKSGYCLTEPYLTTTVAKITRRSNQKNAKDENVDQVIAQVENFAFSKKMEMALYGYNDLKKFKSIEECLDAVAHKQADATYLYVYSAQQKLLSDAYSDLVMTVLPQYNVQLSIAVSNNCDHLLQSILDKAVRNISSPVRQNIIMDETAVTADNITLRSMIRSNPALALGMVLAVCLLFFAGIYLWQSDKAAKREKAQALELARFMGYTCKANDAVLEVNFKDRICNQMVVKNDVISRIPYDFQYYDYENNPGELIHPEDMKAVAENLNPANLQSLLKTGQGESYAEVRIKDADGEYHWVSYNLQPIPVDETRPCNFVIFKKDIDQLKKAEEAKNQALQDALDGAYRASEAKGTFLSRMSHEIRTPLNAIIGYLALAKMSESDMDKINHCLDNSEIASRHLLSIINDVLDISAIERGKMKIANTSFDLKGLITNVSTIFYNQAQAKGVVFNTVIEDLTEEWVVGDQLRVNQILVNLLGNAVKFTPEGGQITLGISQLSVDDKEVRMLFKVSDTGIGMSEEYKSRLFKPFEQESASTAQKFGGTGLGLSITKNLITMMQGAIEVESQPGDGTTFKVTICFGKSEENSKLHVAGSDFSNIRALVVDDEESSCDYVKALLKRCGVRSTVVGSGEAAIKQIQRRIGTDQYYDLCIFDWNMPNLDGVATAKRIHDTFDEKIPIIIATAYDITSFEAEAKAAGVSKIVSKPLFQSTMFDLLVTTFGKYTPKGSLEKADIDLKGIKLILAEDNAMNMEIAVEILKKAGVDIVPANNGKEAVDKFMAAAPCEYQAILMDIQMPVMNGYEATKAIRSSSHPEAKTIPIIAMTANAFTEDVTEALAAGMNNHIAKPIDYDKLFKVLQSCFKKK